MAGEPLVLVVEDEPAQREVLAYNIRAEGYEVVTAEAGDEALVVVRETPPDVIILDWMLPNVSGIEVCRQLKMSGDTARIPVIMLSARSEETDKVRGLETGADDYIVKPYSVVELLARVRTQLAARARPRWANGSNSRTSSSIWPNTGVYRDGVSLSLGPTEFRLLTAFMERPGRVWSREQLLDRVWGRDIYVDSRTVDVHVGRLRKALRAADAGDPIRTVRGAGYALG
jgi:two-component system phosphate regulon response regulator PhoB